MRHSETDPARAASDGGARFRLPDGSRSAQSVFVWRAFLLLSFIALGICLSCALDRRSAYAVAWGVIAAGWFAISMFLWRQHLVVASPNPPQPKASTSPTRSAVHRPRHR